MVINSGIQINTNTDVHTDIGNQSSYSSLNQHCSFHLSTCNQNRLLRSKFEACFYFIQQQQYGGRVDNTGCMTDSTICAFNFVIICTVCHSAQVTMATLLTAVCYASMFQVCFKPAWHSLFRQRDRNAHFYMFSDASSKWFIIIKQKFLEPEAGVFQPTISCIRLTIRIRLCHLHRGLCLSPKFSLCCTRKHQVWTDRGQKGFPIPLLTVMILPPLSHKIHAGQADTITLVMTPLHNSNTKTESRHRNHRP